MNANGITLAADRNPWERQPRESEKQYAAFQQFLAMEPPRTIVRFAEQTMRMSVGHLYDWSSRNHWMDRCIHYDGFMQRSQDAALVEQRKEMNERHAKLAKAMSGKVAARIATLQPEDLSPGELGRWMQVISMVERLALGEGPGNAAVDVDVNVQVDARQQDITLDAAHIGEVMDRLAALGVVPQPIASTVIDVGDSEVVTPEGGTSSTE